MNSDRHFICTVKYGNDGNVVDAKEIQIVLFKYNMNDFFG